MYMHLISVALSALAMSGVAVAAPATTPTDTTSWASNKPSSGSYLATFYIFWGEIGFGALDPTEFISYGKLNTCYNLPGPAEGSTDFEHTTGSIKPAAGISCWVYKVANCEGTDYTTVTGKGDLVYEGNSFSFICVSTPASGSK